MQPNVMRFVCRCGREVTLVGTPDGAKVTDAAIVEAMSRYGWTPTRPPGMYECGACAQAPREPK